MQPESRPWLFSLATTRTARATSGDVTYDQERQVSLVVEPDGREVLAIEALSPPVSKKADIEKGEDIKDGWIR